MSHERKRQLLEELRTALRGEGWPTPKDAFEHLYTLSEKGLSRKELFDALSEFVTRPSPGTGQSVIDFADELMAHLVGQCNQFDIIRLHGDPPGLEALIQHVTKQAAEILEPRVERSLRRRRSRS